jgi:transaldolase
MPDTPLTQLADHGQSVWVDFLSRTFVQDGTLAALVRDGVKGVTSNPTIFQSAIAGGDAYDDQLREVLKTETEPKEVFLALAVEDIRAACDILRPVWNEVGENARDGWVSLEVDPTLAHDTDATIEEAKRLHALVDRPNLFIKIPATKPGLPAITQVISEGISVNVTLIFSIDRYQAVMDAYASGLEKRVAAGESLEGIESVASFFVSRVDTEVDKRLQTIGGDAALALQGKAAIANARLAYAAYEEFVATDRWQRIEQAGARRQRPLWASTGVKNPDYPDTMYVTELVAPGIVNTMPEATLDAVADHGEITGDTIRPNYDNAREVKQALRNVGIDLVDVTHVLEEEGVEKFETSWNDLLNTVTATLEASR